VHGRTKETALGAAPNQTAREIFADLAVLPAAERSAALAQLCAADPALRSHVEALLAAHDQAGREGFLISPTAEGRGASARAPGDPGERPGDHIGPYKLLQEIGEGGFGAVFLAEQERPV